MREETTTVVSAAEHAHPVAVLTPDRPSRTDLGNIEALAASMALEGLRYPVLLTSDNRLLKGSRRLAAAKRLGWTSVQARVVATVEEAVEAIIEQRDETCKPRSTVEAVGLCLQVEGLPRLGDRPPRGTALYDTSYVAGGAAFSSGTTYKRARYVVQMSRSQNRPAHLVELAQAAIVHIDAGHTITTGYNMVKVAEKVPVIDGLGRDGLPLVPPPMRTARSAKAVKLRRDWIRALAAKGATVESMAKALDVSVGGLRHMFKKMELELPADKAMPRVARRAADPNRAMRVAIDDLEALVWSLDNIDVAALDVGEVDGWAAQLREYARSIDRVARRTTKEHAR